MPWRSPSEIAFRLRQEVRNLALLTRPPGLPESLIPRPVFPDPESAVQVLRPTPSADQLVALADKILRHEFPLLGFEIQTGPDIQWRRDYVSGKESPVDYFRRIPYLNTSVVGDHKVIWELNRHQHLVLLAQAYRINGKPEYLDEIVSQLNSWFEQNPLQRGINWASALEVAFRSLSWMWVDHLAGSFLETSQRRRIIEGLYRHAFHIEANLSVYFSPNTHLLGEAVALHALGRMFQNSRAGRRWESLGARIVNEEMQHQVRDDGSHFEQSSYYHVYALDMFLLHATLTQPSDVYLRSLERMAAYLEALLGTERRLAFLGDDDGGRLFHPYGSRERFGAATLTACGCYANRPEWIGSEDEFRETAIWWLGARASKPRQRNSTTAGGSVRFPESGTVVLRSPIAHCIIDAGPFGPFRGGHSHADTLSIVARANGQDLLIDPGTFTYADAPWRDKFRGTAAHNTVRIGGLDQADPAGTFGWRNPPAVEILEWATGEASDYLDARCSYRGFHQRRRIFFRKPDVLFVFDEVNSDDINGDETQLASIDAEQFWHPGAEVRQLGPGCFQIGSAGTLVLSDSASDVDEGGEFGWRSLGYGQKQPAPIIVSRQIVSTRSGARSVQFGAALIFSPSAAATVLEIASQPSNVAMMLGNPWNLVVHFPASGLPQLSPSKLS